MRRPTLTLVLTGGPLLSSMEYMWEADAQMRRAEAKIRGAEAKVREAEVELRAADANVAAATALMSQGGGFGPLNPMGSVFFGGPIFGLHRSGG